MQTSFKYHSLALKREGDAGVVDGVLGDYVSHARELVRPRLEDLAAGRHVVEEVLHRDLRALGWPIRFDNSDSVRI